MKEFLLVGCGGFIGSVLRYYVAMLNSKFETLSLPIGTLTVNVVGSFVIGIIVALADKKGIVPADIRLFLTVGLCGGFTTFSSFTAENLKLLINGEFISAIIYILASVFLGLLAVFLGYKLIL